MPFSTSQGWVQLQKFNSTLTPKSSTPTLIPTPTPHQKFNSTPTQNSSTPTPIPTLELELEFKISTQYLQTILKNMNFNI